MSICSDGVRIKVTREPQLFRRMPLAGMVLSETAITISVELLARRAHLSLATILVERSLLALLLLGLVLRPPAWSGGRGLRAWRC